MILIVAGGYGCGTTHAYRIAIATLEVAGLKPTYFGVSADRWPNVKRPAGWLIVKTHDAVVAPFDDTRVVLCWRDLYDAAASILRRRPEAEMLKGLGQRARIDAAYIGRADVLEIGYEHYYADSLAKIRAIAGHAGIDLSENDVAAVHARTNIETTRAAQARLTTADPTELRPDHIGPNDGAPGAGASLDPALKARIDAAYGAGRPSPRTA